jgi:hypothetical protein
MEKTFASIQIQGLVEIRILYSSQVDEFRIFNITPA